MTSPTNDAEGAEPIAPSESVSTGEPSPRRSYGSWDRPPPTREQFGTDEEFEESRSRWQWTVGRNRAFADLASKPSRPEQLDQGCDRRKLPDEA